MLTNNKNAKVCKKDRLNPNTNEIKAFTINPETKNIAAIKANTSITAINATTRLLLAS
jgi:hypothetical protein